MMKIIITGSSGQIGTNLGLRLQDMGAEVIGIDRRRNTWTEDIETLHSDLGVLCESRRNRIGTAQVPDNVNLVVHLAAHAKVHASCSAPRDALENEIITYNVLRFCAANHIPLIFSSSREVYGHLRAAPATISEPRASHRAVRSPYGASKISCEAMIHAYARSYGIPFLIFRLSNVFGRYDDDLERLERVIPLFMRLIIAHEPVRIFGVEKVLDFTHVDDVVEGLVKGINAILEQRVNNEIINLASGRGHSLLEVAEKIGEHLGLDVRADFYPARPCEVTYYVADIHKARRLLGFAPQVGLSDGIRRSLEWSRQCNTTDARKVNWTLCCNDRDTAS